MFSADLYKEINISLKNHLQNIDFNSFSSLEDLLTAVYTILLAKYTDQDRIYININKLYNGSLQQEYIEININFEENISLLIKKIACKLFSNNNHEIAHVDAIVLFTDDNNLQPDIFSCLNQNDKCLHSEFIFIINTSTYDQKIFYKEKLYSEKNTIALDGHIKQIISIITKKPDVLLKEIMILTPDEWNKIIIEWNMTDASYPKDKSIPELFAEIVKKYGSSTALTFKNKQMTYKELDDIAANLARYLTSRTSETKGKLIAIYMERSLESFISLLGILKAGLAYLPLHLYFPPERIRTILEDAGINTLITQERLLPTLNEANDIDTHIIPIEDILAKNHRGKECINEIRSCDLAYVIYTSGTTGKPKGTKISHKGVCNLITHVKNDFAVTHQTRVLQFASLSFDASVYEWAGALLNGAELCILAEDELPPKVDLSHFMREKEINFALLPPPLLESIDSNDLKDLHTLVSGGEACTQNIVDKWANGRRLFNAYGPSEATVACSFSHCHPQEKITIGKPIQNVKLYVLNKLKQPMPIGIPGELYIGGVGLAQGYLNRQDLTEKSFITNHFSLNQEDRLYKTGDRVRWLENGEIEYIDRIDSQIKLEGYRIELGEIESVLNQFDEIESSSVLVNKIDEVHKQLIAFYIVKKGVKDLDKERLKAFLDKKLPRYMIPASYMKLLNFPLTLTNKVDRKALIKIYETSKNKFINDNKHKELVPILEQTWRELLTCKDVTGNFFSLGGDSIRAIQCVAILRRYGYHITSKTLYDNPTIEKLASFLDKNKQFQFASNKEESLPEGEFSLSPIQHWFFEHQFKDYNQWNQAFLFKTRTPINKEYLYKALKILIQHHDTLRLRYKIEIREIKQYYNDTEEAYSFLFKEIDLPENKSSNSNWITKECLKIQNSLDIVKGPVLAAAIFNHHKDGNQRVLIAIHHLIIDGVSWRILLEDFFNIYDQLYRLEDVKTLPKSDHYSTWIKGLSQYAKKEATVSQLAHWKNITAKIKQEKGKRINFIKDQEHYALAFPKKVTLSLLQDLPNHYPLQINDILLAGLVYALYEENKFYEYMIDLEGHGREECIEGVDVTRTLGWFTTIFPVLLKVPLSFQTLNEASWGNLLLETKKELHQIPDKGIAYGILRYLTNSASEKELLAANSPILFNYLGQFDLASKHQNMWSFASESPGNPIGTDYFGRANYSRYELEINALTIQGSLCINFNYNKYVYSRNKIKRLANNYKKALDRFITIGKRLSLGDLYLPSDQAFSTIKVNELNENIEHEAYKPFSLVNVTDYKDVISDLSLIEDIYPASYLQRRMLSEAYQDDKGTYHIVSNYSINARLDKNKLIKIFKKLAKKHELLRASFILDAENDYSVVIFKSLELECHFFENHDSKELINNEKVNHFDYSKPGLFRILVNNKGDSFDLILSIHNALEDGWSMATLVNEFSHAYIKNKPISTKLKVRYGEFVRNEIAAVNNQDNIKFWREYLDGSNVIKAMWKSNSERSENSLYSSFFILNAESVSLIHKISKELKISVDSIFLLTYLKTLSHFVATSDITIGVARHNRLEKEDGDKLFGLFINILPFRDNLKNYASELTQLLEIFDKKMALQKYKKLPYDYIKSFYNKELYEFVFDFVHLHNLSERASGIESVDGYERTHIPFTLTVAQKGENTFALSILAHDDFISRESLNNFTQYLIGCLSETLDLIHWQMYHKMYPKAANE